MIVRPFRLSPTASLVAASLIGISSVAVAQVQLEDRWPAPTQQMEQRAPAATEAPAEGQPAAKPRAARKPKPAPTPAAEGADPAVAPAPRAAAAKPAAAPAGAPKAIACSGVFAKSSNHLALASTFNDKNVTFTEVDGPEGSKLNATVLFPDDPKRRLEVLWQNEAARSDTALIVVTGGSTWTGPKGLKLGLGLAALEKINGKPFKLKGFDQDDGGSVVDWQGGALASLPGGCSVGLRFAPDPKATEAAKAQAAGKEFVSTDAALKGVKPVVAEILFGYPQSP
ncbi:hypothetical protein [Rhodoplanes roseus]|uniref:Uncharacterized protein n=1 Tax=Rhodoplanes roseus TaxID=29409 RepID=A0A327L4T3_9BRAD|nr:hypothetical protein [Rhodoplanes roseus]RAI45416.1 hypothetical protein CH341_04020 [Rhodoplanes roseus]